MSTPDVKPPAVVPSEVAGVSLPPEVAAKAAEKQGKPPTGIANLNVHTPEGRAQVEQVLLDLGLNMPEFMTGAESKLVASMSDKSLGELGELGKIAAGATAANAAASAGLQGRWADFIAKQKIGSATDVNALVQQVLREAYLENTKDLHFFAQKVRFYNKLKQLIRDELTEARKFLSGKAGDSDTTTDGEGTETSTPVLWQEDYVNSHGTNGPLEFSTTAMVTDGSVEPAEPGTAKGIADSKAGLEAYIESLEEQLNSVGDDAQLANVDLQNMLQKQQQTLQMMSNISKMLHDTAMAIIRKIGS